LGQEGKVVTTDLRSYFPNSNTVILNKNSGSISTKYTFLKDPHNGIENVYWGYHNLNKAGVPYQWCKQYWRNGAWCTDTYAILFMGDDQSVTETGDWYASTPCTPNVVLGYKTTGGANTGLAWAPAGGISTTPAIVECDVWRQNTPGAAYTNSGTKTYSRAALIEHFDTFTPKFGRDVNGVWGEGLSKSYLDVIHIIMYHGTKNASSPQVRCVGPMTANGAYYQSYKDYNSYAIELWLAAGVGVIQENCPFIEDASAWGGTISNCSGDIFANPVGSWVTYIDQP
jgi:hypothetical protein